MKTNFVPLLRIPVLAMALAIAPSAFAQAWPTKPVRMVAAFPPGTPGDVIARLIQPALQTAWGQPVASRSGINGSTTFDLGHRSAGAVLLWITSLAVPCHSAFWSASDFSDG